MLENENDMIQDAVYTPVTENSSADAASRMEQAVYTHTEPQQKKQKKNKANNNFKTIVATGLICSLVGGGIGGVIGANSVEVSYSGGGSTVQLVGNSGGNFPGYCHC